jgi:hypothetical protein
VTTLPSTTLCEQALPQSIPAEVPTTFPFPFFETDIVADFNAKLAAHVLPAFMVTEPSLQSVSPVQPVNFEFAAGIGVSVTTFPAM